MGKEHKFPYEWTLKDANFTKDKGKVFSCFACGGGSTMGYKLAGFDVIGCNEIDPRMNKCYLENHHPKYNFLCDIREMVKSVDLPSELYNLDVLDGSPPCSTFSMAGSREDAWGVEKKFKEGQKAQVLDTLFFDFIDLAKKLQPKVVVAENVKGLLLGSAKKYVMRIYDEFDKAGYYCQHFLLDGSKMGIPQKRERVFFLCIRKDLGSAFLVNKNLFDVVPLINMDFYEYDIPYKEFMDNEGQEFKGEVMTHLWDNRRKGDKSMKEAFVRLYGKESFYSQTYLYPDKVPSTFLAHRDSLIPFHKKTYISFHEAACISSFPQDYNMLNMDYGYLMGMSVPPVMMAQVASRVWDYWLSKINN